MVVEKLPTGHINPRSVEREMADWIALDRLMEGDFPRKREYEEVSAKAKSTLDRMKLSFNMPNGYEVLIKAAEELQELTRAAMSIRSDVGMSNVKGALNVPIGASAESVLEPGIGTATEALGEGHAKEVSSYLMSLVRAFEINPTDTLKNDVRGNMFYTSGRGIVEVNIPAVSRERTNLENLRTQCQTSGRPGLEPLIALVNKFLVTLEEIERIDPNQQRIDHSIWHKNTYAGKEIDWGPGRKLAALVGAFITTLGLGQFLKSGQLSPATAGWAFVTWLAATGGSAFRGAGRKAIENLPSNSPIPEEMKEILDDPDSSYHFAKLGEPQVDAAVRAGFKSEEGKQAFEELQNIVHKGKETKEILKKLQRSQRDITIADLGALTENNPKSQLFKILSRETMTSGMRQSILTAFGAKFSKDNQDYVAEMIRERS